MKLKDVKRGGIYNAKVSGRMVKVRVDDITTAEKYAGLDGYAHPKFRTVTRLACTNLRTNRQIKCTAARLRGIAVRKVKVRTTYHEGKQQEFGWLPPEWRCEAIGLGYAQVGRGATEEIAIVTFIWRVESETGIRPEVEVTSRNGCTSWARMVQRGPRHQSGSRR